MGPVFFPKNTMIVMEAVWQKLTVKANVVEALN
jgi:hypothetical protein